MKKCIITVVGKDRVGIIAGVCNYLAQTNINVLDINQTIVDGYFNMMAIVDTSESNEPFAVVSSELEKLGETIGVAIHIQRSEIFEKMHRL